MTAYDFYGWVLALSSMGSLTFLIFMYQRYKNMLLYFTDLVVYMVAALVVVWILYLSYEFLVFIDTWFWAWRELRYIAVKKEERSLAFMQVPLIRMMDVTAAHALPASNSSFKIEKVFRPGIQFGAALVAGQRVGKTHQARLISELWVNEGFEVQVIGPKVLEEEWASAVKIYSGYDAVDQRLAALMSEVEMRHRNKDYSKQVLVILDDWTTIASRCKNASAAMIDACSLWLSASISFIVLLHSDTSKAFGVERVGASLKENLIRVYLSAKRNEFGMPIRSQTRAEIFFPGENVGNPIELMESAESVRESGNPTRILLADSCNEDDKRIRDWIKEKKGGGWVECRRNLNLSGSSEKFAVKFKEIKKGLGY